MAKIRFDGVTEDQKLEFLDRLKRVYDFEGRVIEDMRSEPFVVLREREGKPDQRRVDKKVDEFLGNVLKFY